MGGALAVRRVLQGQGRVAAQWAAGEGTTAADKKYRKLAKIVGPDPLPYGMKANAKTVVALEDTAFKQKLTPRRMSIAELFVDPEA